MSYRKLTPEEERVIIHTAAGRVLMTRSTGQSGVIWMLTAAGLRLCAPTATGIWGMFLKVRVSHLKTPGTASTLFQWFSAQNKSIFKPPARSKMPLGILIYFQKALCVGKTRTVTRHKNNEIWLENRI